MWSSPNLNHEVNKVTETVYRIHNHIDDEGNALIVWGERSQISFIPPMISSVAYNKNQWSRPTTTKAVLPYIFNHKGQLILTWLNSTKAPAFSFYENGELSETFDSKTDQSEINRHLNLINYSPM